MAVITPNIYYYPDIAIWDETDMDCVYGALVDPAQEDHASIRCAIVRIQKAANITKIMWANGDVRRDKSWADRASLTYKFLQ